MIYNINTPTLLNYDVILFITSFSNETVPGFYYILFEYIDKYIAVYVNSFKGILDVLNYFITNNIINSNKIIWLNDHILYKFKSITFIPNKYHMIDEISTNTLIHKYLLKKPTITYSNICIIKSNISINTTGDGIVNILNVINYCKKHKLTHIEPSNYNEVDLINIIYNCEN